MDTLPIIIDSHIVNAQVNVSASEAPPLFTFLYGRGKVMLYGIFACWFVLLFELGSPSATQAGLKLEILLPQPFECWNYKYALSESDST